MSRRRPHSTSRAAPLALLAGLLAGPQAWAQVDGGWQVELVVFSYRAPTATGEQVLEPPAPGLLPPMMPAPPLAGDIEAVAALPQTRYPLLEPEAQQLGRIVQRLARSAEFMPLLHLAWQQDAPARRTTAQPQELPLLAGSEGLHGTVRLYRRQSLHVELDLWLPAEEDGVEGRYRLRETRIVRSGELSYFDHPQLGAIIKVSPVAAEDSGS